MTVDDAFALFRSGFEAGRLGHAFVIVGPVKGVGGELATRIASLVLCSGPGRPCGECRACRDVARGSYPDLFRIEPASKSRQISAEQMRDLAGKASQTAFTGGWKVGLILAADRMNASSANCFLKTLEEPPPMTLFLLVTDEPNAMLATVLSRCQRISLGVGDLASDAEWRKLVSGLLAVQADLGGLAGAFARGDRLAKTLKGIRQQVEDDVADAATEAGEELDEATLAARAGARYREMRRGIMRALLAWYRDLLALRCGVDASGLTYGESCSILSGLARGISLRQAIDNLDIVETMNEQMDRNLPEAYTLAIGFSRLS